MRPVSLYPRALLGFLAAFLLAAALRALAQDKFVPACTLSYESIAEKRDIDRKCPHEAQTKTDAHKAQNRAKNELCAAGAPVTLTHKNFVAVQKRAEELDIPFGSSAKIPQDRKVLRNILTLPGGRKVGEGSVVRYVGFITHPRYSNRSKGESVNCKVGGAENNDIHLDLAQRPKDPACRTVTAEIIPHYRPTAWEVENLNLVMDRPVRVTGHLFFDASHKPCANDRDTVQPKRISIWEIHPVYAIDVCLDTTLGRCRANNERAWMPLHQWLNEEQQEEDEE